MIIWIILFIISFVINIILFWYIRTLFRNIIIVGQELRKIKLNIYEYLNHLEHVHSLETFYGDATLQSLIKHGKILVKKVKKVQNLFDSIEEVHIANKTEIIT